MARISYLLCLVLIVMSVSASASARRPPVTEDNEASIPFPSPLSYGGSGKTKPGDFASHTDVSRSNNEGSDPLSYGGSGKKKPGDFASHADVSRSNNEGSDPLSYGGSGKTKPGDFASHTDVSRSNNEGSDPMSQRSLPKGIMNKKTESESGDGDRNGGLKQIPVNMAIGLIPVIPGGDGSFHFNLGPIDFGGSIGWGGGYVPGYVYSQLQPYVIVSPYTSPYPLPSPYAPPIIGPGQDQPSTWSSGSSPSAQGSGLVSSEIGGSAANQHD